MKGLIFGAGVNGKICLHGLTRQYGIEVLAFVDNFPEKYKGSCEKLPVIRPIDIQHYSYDKIFVSTKKQEDIQFITEQLEKMGIKKETVEIMAFSYDYRNVYLDERKIWIRDLSKFIYTQNIKGNVAECGVYRGDTARFINEYFPDRKLYLFDTFKGFPKQNLDFELQLGNQEFNHSEFAEGVFEKYNIEDNINTVKKKLPYPQNSFFIIGKFPESAFEIDDQFSFVNLDMDLFRSMLDGLHYFWDKMDIGGVILLHDYFHPELPGVARAVVTFERDKGYKIPKLPIGDGLSIALMKHK